VAGDYFTLGFGSEKLKGIFGNYGKMVDEGNTKGAITKGAGDFGMGVAALAIPGFGQVMYGRNMYKDHQYEKVRKEFSMTVPEINKLRDEGKSPLDIRNMQDYMKKLRIEGKSQKEIDAIMSSNITPMTDTNIRQIRPLNENLNNSPGNSLNDDNLDWTQGYPKPKRNQIQILPPSPNIGVIPGTAYPSLYSPQGSIPVQSQNVSSGNNKLEVKHNHEYSGVISVEGNGKTIDLVMNNQQMMRNLTQNIAMTTNQNMNMGRINNSGGLLWGNFNRGMF
jgi:hypothetical protein